MPITSAVASTLGVNPRTGTVTTAARLQALRLGGTTQPIVNLTTARNPVSNAATNLATTRPPGATNVAGQANALDLGPIVGGVGTAACALIPNLAARQLCIAAAQAVGTSLSGPTQKSGNTGSVVPPTTTGIVPGPGSTVCPAGTVRVGNTCVSPGDVFPGGDPLTFPASGPVGNGMMGMPAFQPLMDQQIVLRCPKRYVLAIDNLCYPKGFIPRGLRKWRPTPKPLLSAMDNKILTRAHSVRAKLRRVAGKHIPRPPKRGGKK